MPTPDQPFVLGGRVSRRPQRATLLAVGAVLAVVALPLRGLYLSTGSSMEEGFMIVFPMRVLAGDVPNVDFLHLYGPFSLHVLAGVFVWTLTEYVLHRFVFHLIPKSGWGRKLHFVLHGVHHLDPWDRTRLVFPPVGGILIMGAIFGLWTLVLPVASVVAGFVGFVIGYITYDMTHYYTHHGRPKSRWGKFLKTWHLAHHHKAWEAMYGVSSPLWDYVFGSVPDEVRQRRQKAKAKVDASA